MKRNAFYFCKESADATPKRSVKEQQKPSYLVGSTQVSASVANSHLENVVLTDKSIQRDTIVDTCISLCIWFTLEIMARTGTVCQISQSHFWGSTQLLLVQISLSPRKACPRAELSALDHLTSFQSPGGPPLTTPVS